MNNEKFLLKENDVFLIWGKNRVNGKIRLYSFFDSDLKKDNYKIVFYIREVSNFDNGRHYFNEAKNFLQKKGLEGTSVVAAAILDMQLKRKVPFAPRIWSWLSKDIKNDVINEYESMKDKAFDIEKIEERVCNITLSKVDHLYRRDAFLFLGEQITDNESPSWYVLCFNNSTTAKFWEEKVFKCQKYIGIVAKKVSNISGLSEFMSIHSEDVCLPMSCYDVKLTSYYHLEKVSLLSYHIDTYKQQCLDNAGVLRIEKIENNYYLEFRPYNFQKEITIIDFSKIMYVNTKIGVIETKPDLGFPLFYIRIHLESGETYLLDFLQLDAKGYRDYRDNERLKWHDTIDNLRCLPDNIIPFLGESSLK